MNRHFFQRGNADGQKAHKKMQNIAVIRGMQINTTTDTTSHLSKGLSSERIQITNTGEEVEKRDPSDMISGNVNWCNMVVPQKVDLP